MIIASCVMWKMYFLKWYHVTILVLVHNTGSEEQKNSLRICNEESKIISLTTDNKRYIETLDLPYRLCKLVV